QTWRQVRNHIQTAGLVSGRICTRLQRISPNSGSFSFLPKPAENGFSSWELGSLRIRPSIYPDGMWNVQAAWTDDHAWPWHLEEKFRQNSTVWALDKCVAWNQLENALPNFLSELIDCPCTLAQARADTPGGQDYAVDIEKGSVCTYHPGICSLCEVYTCQSNVLTADSNGGSSPDRAHDWGSPPFKKPPRIPGDSHWVDCRRYKSPSSAVVLEIPHFITFDGVSYSFNGFGEYTLPCKKTPSDIIEVRLVSGHNGLEVLQNQKTLSFSEQSWMDLHGVFVFSPTSSNVTVMFSSGVGVEVRLREGTMTTTVLLPEEFIDTTMGLLGKMNGDPKDDLALTNGELVQNRTNPEEVFNFGQALIRRLRYARDRALSSAGTISWWVVVPEWDTLQKISYQSHISLEEDLKPVISCGWFSPPSNGKKEGTTYLQGAKETQTVWFGGDTKCVVPSMNKL
ncbi:hypothetical protein KUCAC02_008688, partial [Chaenocephalus aceratus]